MSDVFSPLHRLEETPVGLDPEEVRRLGDRRRHRRTAGRVGLAAAVALGVVAVGANVVDGPGTDAVDPARPIRGLDDDRVVDPPEPERLIPPAFPLATGLESAAGGPDLAGPEVAPFPGVVPATCGSAYELTGRPVDRLAMEGTNQVFGGVRDLAVYRGDSQARAAARGWVDVLERCAREDLDGLLATTTVTSVPLGDEGWRAVRSYSSGGTVTSALVWFVVQRGPAVLVMAENVEDEPGTFPSSEAADLQRGFEDYLADYEQQQVRPVVEALCRVDTVC